MQRAEAACAPEVWNGEPRRKLPRPGRKMTLAEARDQAFRKFGPALKRLADETGLKDFRKEMPAQMVSIEFAKADRPASQRDRDVARRCNEIRLAIDEQAISIVSDIRTGEGRSAIARDMEFVEGQDCTGCHRRRTCTSDVETINRCETR